MNRENRRGFALSGALLALSVLSFSDTARAQSVTVTPSVLNFTGNANQVVTQCNGGTDCKVHVTGSGVGTVQVQVSSLSPWIRVNTVVQNLPGDLSVSVDTSTLSAGSSTGTFIVYSSSNSTIQQTVTVNVTVANTSQISATPASLTFQAQLGATFGTPQSGSCPIQNGPASCQITIQTTSATPITYNITPSTQDGHPWLQPDAASGRTNGSPFNVAVNPQVIQSLGAGTYLGSILIQSTTSSSDTVSVSVTLVVSATPTLTVAPAQLTFYYTVGGTVPPPQTTTVSASAGSAAFSVSQSAGSTWLGVSPIQGVASPTSSVPLNVSVSPTTPTQLGIGPHTATLTISPNAGGAAQTVTVTLYVSVNPFLTVPSNQLQLSFNAPFGGPAPAAQNITVGTTGGTLVFTASASSDQNWLTFPSGTSGGGTTGTASGTISATVDPNVLPTLGVGTYNGTIVLSPKNGDQYNIQITATLTVGAASQITAAPQAVFFSYQIGQSAPAAQTLALAASGPPVSFSISTALSAANPSTCGTASWLSATAQSSPLTTPNAITVAVNPAGMTSGICTGTVKIAYAGLSGNTELDVPVTFFVSTSALLNISLPQGFGIEATTLGGANITRQISMTSTDNATAINYTVTFSSGSPCQWLFAAPLAGTTPTPLQVSIQPSCITVPGSYPGTVTINSANLPQPVTLAITLTVSSNVQVAVTPQALSFTQTLNGPLPDPQKLTFTVSGGNAPFIATANTDLGNWLQVTPSSGNTSINSISVSVAANNLPVSATPYNGRITLTFQNASTPAAVIPVKYTVNAAQTVTVSPSQALTFSYPLGGAAPAAQQLNVSSTGGPVNFTVGTSSTGGWLNVDATSGTTGASGNPKAINVTIDPSKIPAGTLAGATLNGAITIGAPGVLTNSIIENVILNITAAAAPQPGTILNSASISAGAAGISPGELIAIKGVNLGPATPAAGTSFTVNANGTVSSTLAGVQVTFNGTPGIPTYVSATQINVIVPWEVATFSSVSMVISFNGGLSAAQNLNVVATSPAIYTQNATGAGQAAAVNLGPPTAASPYNGPLGGTYPGTTPPLALAPAAPGSFISFFLAGCGQTNPSSTTGSINPSNTLLPLRNWTQGSNVVTATIGGQSAFVQFAGGAPTLLSGVCQVNLQVPAGVSGNNLAVAISVNGVQTLGTATIAVQ
jgi:uncharacterized protein (TIGR03437 family)